MVVQHPAAGPVFEDALAAGSVYVAVRSEDCRASVVGQAGAAALVDLRSEND